MDDLLEKFRAYHKRQAPMTLVELRQSYDMLMLKTLSLLQDADNGHRWRLERGR